MQSFEHKLRWVIHVIRMKEGRTFRALMSYVSGRRPVDGLLKGRTMVLEFLEK